MLLADDAKDIQGTWLPKSITLSGQALDEKAFAGMHVTLSQGKYTALVQGKEDLGVYSIAADKAPKEIVIEGKEGPSKGLKMLGAYKLEGDTLTICYGLDGKAPADFKSETGMQRLLIVYERKK